MEIIAGLLSCAVLEGDWTWRTVWTEIILTERRWNGDGTETWRIVWIGHYCVYGWATRHEFIFHVNSITLCRNIFTAFIHLPVILIFPDLNVGGDSSVGKATRYGTDGLGNESQWGRDFPHPSRQTLRLTLLYNGYWVYPDGKAAGAWCWPRTLI